MMIRIMFFDFFCALNNWADCAALYQKYKKFITNKLISGTCFETNFLQNFFRLFRDLFALFEYDSGID